MPMFKEAVNETQCFTNESVTSTMVATKVLGNFAICYFGLNFHHPPPPKQCCFMDEVHAILD